MPTNLENSAVATSLEKVNILSNHKEGQCQRVFKLPHNYTFHMLTMQYSKSFKTHFNSMSTESFQVYKLDLEKAEEPEIKLQSSVVSLKKARKFQKKSNFDSLTRVKSLTVWITTN